MKRIFTRIMVFLLLFSFLGVNVSASGDPDEKREEVESKADKKLEEIKVKNEKEYQELNEAMGIDYDSDYFDDDRPENIFDIFARNFNRSVYKLRAIIQESLLPILFFVLLVSVSLIILFWKKANVLVAKGILLLILGVAAILIFTYYPLIKAYVGTNY